MKIFAIIVVVLISTGLLKNNSKQILSVETSVEPTETAEPTATSTPGPIPTVTLTVTVTPPPQSGDWQYPGSNQISNNKYQTTDDAKKVTDWYVAKIKANGANVTSFVKTNANDQILNSLAAAKNDWKIKVTISKDSGSSTVVITIDN